MLLSDALLHTATDILGVILGLLGLYTFWAELREDTKKRRLAIVALLITVLVEAGFLLYDHYQEKQQELVNEKTLANKELQLIGSLCLRDMNYEEIYTSGSMGWSDETLNSAIDDLMQTKLLVDVDMKYLTLSGPEQRPIQVRFFHLKDRSKCPATTTP